MSVFDKKKPQFLLILIGLILIFLGYGNIKNSNQKTDIPNQKVIQKYYANMIIHTNEGKKEYDLTQYLGKTVLETTTKVLNGKVKTTGTDTNTTVTNLDGLEANSKKGEYWELSINGQVYVKDYVGIVVKNNDMLIWQLKNK